MAHPDSGGNDVELQTYSVTGASNLTLGYHQVNVPLTFDTNPWPTSGEVYLRAEIGGDPTNSVNLYNGAVVTPQGELLVFGTENADTIALRQSATGVVGVTLNSQDLSFSASITSIYVYGYAGNDLVWAANGVDVPMIVYGTGTDSILGDGNSGDSLNGGPGSWISDGGITNDASHSTLTTPYGTTAVNLETDSNNDGSIDDSDAAYEMGPGCNVYVGGSPQPVYVNVTDSSGQFESDTATLTFDGEGTTIEVFDVNGNRIVSGSALGTVSGGKLQTWVWVQALAGGSSVLTLSLDGSSLYDQARVATVAPATPDSNQTFTPVGSSGASVSLLTGELSLPAPADLPISLAYNSQNSNQVAVAFDYTLNAFQTLSSSISATVTIAGSSYSQTVHYSTQGLAAGTTVRLMQNLDLSSSGFDLSSAGTYTVTMTVTDGTITTNLNGYVNYLGGTDDTTSPANFDGDEGSWQLCGDCCVDWIVPAGEYSYYYRPLGAVQPLSAAGAPTDSKDSGGGTMSPPNPPGLLAPPPGGAGDAANPDGAMLEGSNPAWFASPTGPYGPYISPPGFDGTLSGNAYSGFTLSFPDGSVEDFAGEDDYGRCLLKSKTDPQGNVIDFIYNENGQLMSIYDPADPQAGISINSWNASGEVMSLFDGAIGRTCNFTYDGDNRLASISEPTSSPDPASAPAWSYDYDSTTGLLDSVTSPTGAITTFSYVDGRLVGETLIDGGSTDTMSLTSEESQLLDNTSGAGSQSDPIQLLPASQVQASVSDFSGNETTYTTDCFGNVTSQTNALGQTTTYQRDANGNVTQETAPGPNGQSLVTSYTYDANQNLTQKVYPDGSVETWQYDATWNVVASDTDPMGNVTTNQVDSGTGLVLATTKDGQTTTYVYTDGGTAITTDGNGDTIYPAYSAAGLDYTNPSYPSLPVGELLEEIDPLGNVTRYQYDTNSSDVSFGQPIAVTTAYGAAQAATVQYAYDSAGNQTATIDALNRVTASTYDALGNDIADYQGQINDSAGPTWTFSNLSPGDNLSYDVYVPAGSDTTQSDYSVVDQNNHAVSFLPNNDPNAPSLGAGWSLLGIVTVSSISTTALTVTYKTGSGAAQRGLPCAANLGNGPRPRRQRHGHDRRHGPRQGDDL